MTTSGIKFRATVHMLTERELPIVNSLRPGWGPGIFYQNRLFAGRIISCERPIAPGESGDAIIGMIESSNEPSGLQVGSTFELRDGPSIKVANAEVVAFEPA